MATPHNGGFISYLRVSTTKQGKSGVGLEAQRAAVASYLNGGNWNIIAEFKETESGKRSDRPALDKALDRAVRVDFPVCNAAECGVLHARELWGSDNAR
jgi:hypothetical protein